METTVSKRPHAIVMASPGSGHLIPMLELAKRLVAHQGFKVTFFALNAESSSVQSQILSSSSNIPNKHLLHVEVVKVQVLSHELPEDVDPEALLFMQLMITMHKGMPIVRSAISSMKVLPDVFIADMFGMDYWPMAAEFGMSKYVFITMSAWFLALSVYLPVFEKQVSTEELLKLDSIQLPGCTSVQIKDSGAYMAPRDSPPYHWFVRVAKELAASDGILVNSWQDLEPMTIGSLNDKKLLGAVIHGQVYPIGPLVKQPSLDELSRLENDLIFSWMDKQPDRSVLYVSFGSGGSLTYQQIQELAWGLEFSQQRFVWVLRPPLDKDASEFYLRSFDDNTGDNGGRVLDHLPTGFLSRIKDIGVVVPMWAPQAEILGHKSVGGFLTHCGWNSVIESIVNGVPMLAWPLFAEQGMNASMLTEDLKIAVQPVASSPEEKHNIIGRDVIEKTIRKIMVDKEGNGIRERVMKLKDGAARACEAGSIGSSYKALSEFTKTCTMKMK